MSVMPVTDHFAGLPAIFRDCANSDNWRYPDMKRPWVSDGHVYATDGRIIVRVPITGIDPEIVDRLRPQDGQKFPRDPGSIFPVNGPHEPEPVPLPAESPDEYETCDKCGGDGRAECDLGHVHDCPECDGAGQCANLAQVAVGRYFMSARYVAILRRHGITEVYQPVTSGVGPRQETVGAYRFVLGDVEGMLAPRRPDADK